MELHISTTDRIVLKLSKLEFKSTRRKKIDFGNEVTVLNELSSSRVFAIYVCQLRLNFRILQINENHILLLFIRVEMIVNILTKWSFGPHTHTHKKNKWVFEFKVEGCHNSAK